MTADPDDQLQYWYARSGDSALGRMNYTPVHWKGFAALFGAIMVCIWSLVCGVLLIVFTLSGVESIILKIGAVLVGAACIIGSIWLALFSFRTLRKRVDPDNNAKHYHKKFFQKLSGN